jgi:hypothetical protein
MLDMSYLPEVSANFTSTNSGELQRVDFVEELSLAR